MRRKEENDNMNNDLQMTIAYARVKFTRKDHQIADYLLENPAPEKIELLANQIGVSTSSLTRFTKKLGFSSFKEFYYRFRIQLTENRSEITEEKYDDLHHEYINILHDTQELLDSSTAKSICEEIHKRPGFHIFGTGFSTLAAQDLKLRFRRLGKFVEIISDIDSFDMYGPVLKADDLILIISLKGKNERLIKYISILKERKIKIGCMTANKKSRIISLSDFVLATAPLNGEESTGMISPQLPLLMAIDFLYYNYISLYRDSIDTWMETEKNYLLP